MFDAYFVLDTVIVLGLVLLAVITLVGGGIKLADNRLFAAFSILVGVWIVANHISNDTGQTPETATFANYFVFSCSFGAMILIMKLMARIVGEVKSLRLIRYVEPLLWIAFIIAATPLTARGVELQERVYGVIFGPFIPVYGILLLLMVAATYVILIRGLRRQSGSGRARLKVLSWSLSITLPLVVTLSFILPSLTGLFAITEFGVTPILILIAGFYYTIARHQLFDVKFAVVRTMAYLLALVTLSVVYYLLAYLVSATLFQSQTTTEVSISPINIFLALLLAFIFQPIKRFFDKTTDNIFYRDRYRSDEFYARLSEVLTSTTDLRGLLERAAGEVGTTLKAEQAFFFVQYNHVHHVTAGTAHHTGLPIHDVHYLNDYVLKNGDGVLVTQLLGEGTTLRRMLVSHKISLLMPLVRGPLVLGYLALGDQLSSGYTNRDIKVLKTISDELIIAIQNALSVQEVKDINSSLEQRIDAATKELRSSNARLRRLDATKDEFLSMASHQLRTPLTSIKGYLSMVLEGDVGHITPQQRHLLEEAFSGSERMVHLIHDFLNVSRLQTGKFVLETRNYDLVKLARQEVDSLERVASSRHLKLKMETKLRELPLVIDEDKIRQVVMNFIDNAIYYSHEDTTITVELLKKADGIIELRVNDTGIGVPLEEQAQLFSKFYRASNARKQRPDGTGVGLYLAKKVISAHGGEVFFETKEGKGSTFGFRLPLDKLKVEGPTSVPAPVRTLAK